MAQRKSMDKQRSTKHTYKTKDRVKHVWRYQRGYQKLQIGEGQTTQWSKEKVQRKQSMIDTTLHRTLNIKEQEPSKTCSRG